MAIHLACNICGKQLAVPDQYAGKKGKCPQCGATLEVPGGQESPALQFKDEARPPTPATASGGIQDLPEIMRANKRLVGRTCPRCQQAITLGENVHNCMQCGATNHAACWDGSGGCGACVAPSNAHAGAPAMAPAGPAGDTKACRWCGEMIKVTAKKCRFCNEFQDDNIRSKLRERRRDRDWAGDDMSTGDWVVAILCSGIGLIAGIVWAIQGKRKGGKMIGVSLLFVIIWTAVRACIAASQQQRHYYY